MKLVKESLFSSIIRSFCIAFFSVIGIVIAFVVVMLVAGSNKNARASEASMYDIVIPDTNGRKYISQGKQPLLLRINIVGQIGSNNLTINQVRSILTEASMGLFKNNPIKGILLYIDTPGGTASDSVSIYAAIKDYAQKHQIPVYAYADGLCASGGMYIACAAEKVYASSASMIGSVGVVQLFFNVSQGMDKVGIDNKTITAGTNKFAMNPFQPWQEGADSEYIQAANAQYDEFVNTVASARPKLTPELLKNKYGAGCYFAERAAEYGYIDGAGYQYDDVVTMLAQTAEVENYQLIELRPKVSLKNLIPFGGDMNSNQSHWQNFVRSPLLLLQPLFKDMLRYQLTPPVE